MLAEPALNVFGGCDLVDVQLLGHALAKGVPSSEWLGLAQCVRNVVFVWHFLLLVKRRMDEDPLLAHAVGELILFAASRGPAATDLWETKASEAAKEYRAMWQDTSAEQYQEWAAAQGVEPAVIHIVGHAAVQARILEQAEEERTGQAWPGRKLIIGFELLRETESPALLVAALAQRFVRMPRVVYCDTACQTQRNALRRVPWLLTEEEVSFLIDRFHQCGHVCSPVFEAEEYPEILRGHDTSSAERQHSIKKKSKSSLTYMSQHRFIVRSRYMAAYNNIRVSQKREAMAKSVVARAANQALVPLEIQHQTVESYYHKAMVDRCEVTGCNCREGIPAGQSLGFEKKL
ncbi:hypothetical protein I4F81_006066 [Pyropia yezoensis]|uniref:Uncharacterized protein n=1 Tax=Pyropia yezoensis TaxID=2788 RepID=A0ACC3C177_PYRYE|nr:hypothetical protein I4F81_006066 [Neopyropia yezoensis]